MMLLFIGELGDAYRPRLTAVTRLALMGVVMIDENKNGWSCGRVSA